MHRAWFPSTFPAGNDVNPRWCVTARLANGGERELLKIYRRTAVPRKWGLSALSRLTESRKASASPSLSSQSSASKAALFSWLSRICISELSQLKEGHAYAIPSRAREPGNANLPQNPSAIALVPILDFSHRPFLGASLSHHLSPQSKYQIQGLVTAHQNCISFFPSRVSAGESYVLLTAKFHKHFLTNGPSRRLRIQQRDLLSLPTCFLKQIEL